jgi:hypothetical protein
MANSSFLLQECIDKYTFVEEDEEVDSPFARMPRKFGRSSSAASTSSPSPRQRFGQVNHHSHQHASTFRSDQRLRDAADPSSAFSTAEELELSPGGRDSSLSLSSSVGSESSSASLVCLYSGPGGGQLSPLMPLPATPVPPSLLSPPVVDAVSGANRQLGPSMSRASRQDLHSHLWPEEKHRRGNRSPPEQQPAKSAAALPTAGVPLRTNLGPNVRQQNMGSFGSLVNTVAPPLSPTPPIESEAGGGGGGGPPAAEVQHLCQLSKPLPTEPIRRVDLGFGRNPLDKALRFHRGTECYIKKIPQAVVAPFRRHLPEPAAAAPLLPVTPIHRASIAAASAAAAASSVHSGSDSSVVVTTAGEAVLTESVSSPELPTVEATVVTSETLSAESAAGCSSSGSPQSKKICSSEVTQEPQNKVSPSRVESPTPPPHGVTQKSDSDKAKRGGAAGAVKRSPASLSEQSEPLPPDTTTRQRPECRRRDSQESPVPVSCAKRSLRQMKQKQQEEEQRFISLPGGPPDQQILMSRLTSCQVEVLKLHPGPEAVVTASSSKLGPRRKSRAGPGDSSENSAKVPDSSDCRSSPALPEVKLVESQESASMLEAASVTTCVSDPVIEEPTSAAAAKIPEPVPPVVDAHSLHVENSDAASPLDSCEARVLPDQAGMTPQPSPCLPGLPAETPCGDVTIEAEDSGQQVPARKRKRRLNRTGFPSHKVKKRKTQCEPLPAEEKVSINSCEMDVEASVSPLLHSPVPEESISDGRNAGNTSLLMVNKNSDMKFTQMEVATPSLQPKERMQPKRSLEAGSGRPAATTRGRPAKRPRGRPLARTLETPAHSGSNNTSSIEPSPASSDVESLDYRWVQSVSFSKLRIRFDLIRIRTSSVNLIVTFPIVFF